MTGPILYCGDPHGEFRHIIKAADKLRASAVVLMGDLQPERSLGEERRPIADKLWFIHGNHDTDSDAYWERLWDSSLAERNVDGRVVCLPDGTRLAGLGGVFRGAVWHPGLCSGGQSGQSEPVFRNRRDHARSTPRQDRWRGGPHRKHWSTIYPDELDRLSDMRADVLITHEAPGYHHNGFELLDALAQSMGVRVTVHGHHHDCLDSSERWAQQGFKSFGVGLRGITAIDVSGNAEVIVQGALDVERNYRQRYLDVFRDVSN